ncbi:MAG: phospholipase D-like domain-containing protein [Candidatus Ratteibacteria bacterium]|jgi:phosphatidylserine/phosphatidylglycerophosphate/cardiolipin synthase-like enzyme
MKVRFLIFFFFFFSIQSIAGIKVYFSPDNSLDSLVMRAVASARYSIHIASYTMSPEFLSSCRKIARQKNLDLKVILHFPVKGIEPSLNTYRLNSLKKTLHAKFLIIDGCTTIVGSSNFTVAGLQKDINNLLFIDDKRISQTFEEAFNALWNGRIPSCSMEKPDLRVFFTPFSNCEEVIRNEIRKASQSIKFVAFTFTSDEIAEELCRAGLRNISIFGIFERGQRSKYDEHSFLSRFPFQVKYDSFINAVHDKWFLIDNKKIITGSYNFTKTARKNIECVIILSDPMVVERYRKRFRYLWFWY